MKSQISVEHYYNCDTFLNHDSVMISLVYPFVTIHNWRVQLESNTTSYVQTSYDK